MDVADSRNVIYCDKSNGRPRTGNEDPKGASDQPCLRKSSEEDL